MSDPAANTRQYEWFVRQVVEQIGRYEDDGHTPQTPEDKVGRAKRWTDALMDTEEGMDLASEDNVLKVAAMIVAMHEDMERRA